MLSYYLALVEDEGDRTIFTRLYEENHVKVLWIAKRYLKSYELAEDAVHESFISVINNFSKISGNSCQEQAAYLVTTVKHKCIDMLRAKKKGVETVELSEGLAVPFDNVRAEQKLQELSADVRRAVELMQELPPIYHTVIEGRLVQQKTNKELARELGISEDLCAKRYERGRKMLAQKLIEEEIYP